MTNGYLRIMRRLREEKEQREELARYRDALLTIKALKDAYVGGDEGRKSGYRVAGEIAEKALRGKA